MDIKVAELNLHFIFALFQKPLQIYEMSLKYQNSFRHNLLAARSPDLSWKDKLRLTEFTQIDIIQKRNANP